MEQQRLKGVWYAVQALQYAAGRRSLCISIYLYGISISHHLLLMVGIFLNSPFPCVPCHLPGLPCSGHLAVHCTTVRLPVADIFRDQFGTTAMYWIYYLLQLGRASSLLGTACYSHAHAGRHRPFIWTIHQHVHAFVCSIGLAPALPLYCMEHALVPVRFAANNKQT